MKAKKEAFTFKNGQKVFIHPGGAPLVGMMNITGRRLLVDGQDDGKRTIDKETVKALTGRDLDKP